MYLAATQPLSGPASRSAVTPRSARTALAVLLVALVALFGLLDSGQGAVLTYGSNLIANPSFEVNDGVSSAANWTGFGLGFTLTSTAQSGSWACSVTANLTQTAAAYQLISVNSSQPLEVSGWMQGVGLAGAYPPFLSVFMDISFANIAPQFGVALTFSKGSHPYEYRSMIYCPADRVTTINLYAYVKEYLGTAYFDNLSLREITDMGTEPASSPMLMPAGSTLTVGWQTITILARNASGVQVPCGRENMAVSLQYPNGTQVAGTLMDANNGTYTWNVEIPLPGTYTFHASLNGTPLQGSPAVRAVDPGPAYGPRFDTWGPGATEWVAGTPAASCFALRTLAHDRYGNNVTSGPVSLNATVTPAMPNGSVVVTALSDTEHVVRVHTTVAGSYTLSVTAPDGSHVPGSPFTLLVRPSTALLAAYTTDLSGQPTAIATAPRTLWIEARDAYGNANASHAGPITATLVSGSATLSLVRYEANATWALTLLSSVQGAVILTLIDTNSGLALPGSPYTVTVGAGDPVLGNFQLDANGGSLRVRAGSTVTVSVLPRDLLLNVVGTAVALQLNCTPSLPVVATRVVGGPYVWALSTGLRGNHTVTVSYGGLPVPGSPFNVTVIPGTALPSAYTLSGSGLGSVVALVPQTFQITAQDGFGNIPETLPALSIQSSGAVDSVTLTDQGGGLYQVSYRATALGPLSIDVLAGAQLVTGASIRLTAVAGAVATFTAADLTAPLRSTLPGYTSLVTVYLFDSNAFPSPVRAGDVFTASVTGLRAANATVLATVGETSINVTVAGTGQGVYALYVERNGVLIPGGPFVMRLYGRTPRLVSYIVTDPEDKQLGLSVGDSFTLLFDATTSRPPAGDTVAINALLSFSHPIGLQYTGAWRTSAGGTDQLVLTVTDVGAVTAPPVGQARVTVTGNTLLNAARDSRPCNDVSPTLTGNYGQTGCGTYGQIGGRCWWVYLIIALVVGTVLLTVAFVVACVLYSRNRNDEATKATRLSEQRLRKELERERAEGVLGAPGSPSASPTAAAYRKSLKTAPLRSEYGVAGVGPLRRESRKQLLASEGPLGPDIRIEMDDDPDGGEEVAVPVSAPTPDTLFRGLAPPTAAHGSSASDSASSAESEPGTPRRRVQFIDMGAAAGAAEPITENPVRGGRGTAPQSNPLVEPAAATRRSIMKGGTASGPAAAAAAAPAAAAAAEGSSAAASSADRPAPPGTGFVNPFELEAEPVSGGGGGSGGGRSSSRAMLLVRGSGAEDEFDRRHSFLRDMADEPSLETVPSAIHSALADTPVAGDATQSAAAGDAVAADDYRGADGLDDDFVFKV